jgi:hypothetical protein
MSTFDNEYREAAQQEIVDCNGWFRGIEIRDDAKVEEDISGAWVQAWVWVPEEDIGR